ncbi:MAG: glycoside hydrolase [bacterium (Candidatus Stahlbacteria) CG08_land_8_20_14_0_20_40_26]|nr:MAG: glycoside hydrolase [bacterium (Candidatus Stahlbacteria) CG08_land_8_20_14_0_20_40_26]
MRCKKFILFVFVGGMMGSSFVRAEEIEKPPLYLAILWHQHQPLYAKEPESGLYAKPWVRMHAVKDYYDMASILEKYPQIHQTFNLTPSLIIQLEDIISGGQDKYFYLSQKKASELSREDRRFILLRFFDIYQKTLLEPYSRYKELLEKRGRVIEKGGRVISSKTLEQKIGEFTTQDYLDLQVWFNLAWLDPDFKKEESIRFILDKSRNFTEEEKNIILKKHLEILKMIIPEHKKLQNKAQIEITFTPFYHPILPLIYDTDLAKRSAPEISLPLERFSYPEDAQAQVLKGIELYKKYFGREPLGMWPSESAVSQEVVDIIAGAGVKWIATDECVLEKSLNIKIERDIGGNILNPELLCQPYVCERRGKTLSVIFRERYILDLWGKHPRMKAEEAAQDIIDRLHNIYARLPKDKPYLVTLASDGENAWEFFSDDGKEFLNALYSELSGDPIIKTITPSEYLKKHPPEKKIENLWGGSWMGPNFNIWIGEGEENLAWEYLGRTRKDLEVYKKGGEAEPDKLVRAFEEIYAAEGSDWFWWYGEDMNSGDDEGFDLMFRNTLKNVYKIIGKKIPGFLEVPIVKSREGQG